MIGFPEETPTVYDRRYPRSGRLIKVGDHGSALYYFSGDFIVGDAVEYWLDIHEATDVSLLAEVTGWKTRVAHP
jgi:hypothetical protein